MASDRQIAANRRNATQSTGPRSVEGKRRVSSNAVQHGFYGIKFRIRNEDQDQYSLDVRRVHE